MKTARTCAVIGSGIAGLAAAIRLRHHGFEVTVFEKNLAAGGKISELKVDGFRFDRGPTVLTKPEYVDELFELCGKKASDYWNYHAVEPIFNYFFDDGTVIRSSKNEKKFAAEIASKTNASANSVIDFLRRSARKHSLTDEVFLQRSLHRFRNYLNRSTLRGILNFGEVDVFRSMNAANSKQFSDQKVVDIFNRYASYNGSDPYQAPATLNVIAHYEITLGTFFAEGGIQRIISALHKLATDIGVTFEMGTSVDRIITEAGSAIALSTDKGQRKFNLILSNADVHTTYTHLLPELFPPKRYMEQPRSSSVIVFYWGMNRTFEKLGLHNMFLSNNSNEEYRYLFRENDLYEDPTVHLTISSKMNETDAPTGHENWAALISVPHDTGQDWPALVALSRKRVIRKLNGILKTDIEPYIVFESVLDPQKVKTETNAAFGAVFGNSSNGMFSAFLRHPNFSSKLGNLFFCGGTAHPGPGIPLCLLSAKIATDLVMEKFQPQTE